VNLSQFDCWLADKNRWPLVMGVINVTPDSFSDGGRHIDAPAAVATAREMVAQGAAIIDFGAESTRPGSLPVPADEQIRRLKPVLGLLKREPLCAIISIDTTQSAVAQIALEHGILFINDISAGRDDTRMLPLLAQHGATVCLMHMQGTPQTMQQNPSYEDVVTEVRKFLTTRVQAAEGAGIAKNRIIIDPGIGFGKTNRHNLELLNRLKEFAGSCPVLVGTSRKGFIGRVLNEPQVDQRLFGTAATIAWSIANGAAIVRVHDVKPAAQIVRMTYALLNPDSPID
jgi:dihydropteroate synthase